MIPLCAPNIPLSDDIVSKEVLVVVLRRLHIRSNSPLLCVVLKSEILPFSGMCVYQAKRHAEGALLEGLSAQFSI